MLLLKKSCNDSNCNCHMCRELCDCRMDIPRIESYITKPLDTTNFILRRPMPFVKRTPSKEWQEATKCDSYESMSTLEDKTRLPIQCDGIGSKAFNHHPVKSPRTLLSSSCNSLDVKGRKRSELAKLSVPTRPAPPKPLPKPRMVTPEWNEEKIERDSNNKVVIYCGESMNEMNRSDGRDSQMSGMSEVNQMSQMSGMGQMSELNQMNGMDRMSEMGRMSRSQSSWSLRQGPEEIRSTQSDGISHQVLDDHQHSDNVIMNNCECEPSEIIVKISPNREDVLKIEEDETLLEDYWSLPGDTTGFKADWSFVQQWRLRG